MSLIDLERTTRVRATPEVPTREGRIPDAGESQGQDSAALSVQARRLFSGQEEEHLQRIRTRIENGFYLRPEVIDLTLQGLVDDIASPFLA